jgi:hypothetical protein
MCNSRSNAKVHGFAQDLKTDRKTCVLPAGAALLFLQTPGDRLDRRNARKSRSKARVDLD